MIPSVLEPSFVLALGAAVGAAVLVAGVLVGFWVARKPTPPGDPARALQDERVAALLRGVFQWTGEFSDDIKQCRDSLNHLGQNCQGGPGETPTTETTAGPAQVLSQIVTANERLQQRLNSAEAKLHAQGEEIAGYLTEARTDALTGLPNRRAFDTECNRRFKEWQRYGTPYAVVVIDVDHFKSFNDRHGHLVGDKVLAEVARALTGALRDADFAARFGGEEFALVLPVAKLGDAGQAAERMRQAIEQIKFHHVGVDLHVTVSCGTAQALQSENCQALFKRADQALYAAKRNGRNQSWFHDGIRCVCVASKSPTIAVGSTGSPATGNPVSPDLQAACVDLRKRLLEVTMRPAPAERS